MKQTIFNYLRLGFFGMLFGFLIWGLINLVSVFSIQVDGWLTFLSVIIPHVIALGYIGFQLVIAILAVKNRIKAKPTTPPTNPTV
jgi:hypothetical protein